MISAATQVNIDRVANIVSKYGCKKEITEVGNVRIFVPSYASRLTIARKLQRLGLSVYTFDTNGITVLTRAY